MTGIIYLVRNKLNNKCYIGSTTTSYNTRIQQHIYNLGRFPHRLMYSKILKYGLENFEFTKLKEYEEIDKDKLKLKELKYIIRFNSFNHGYNIRMPCII